MHAKGRRCDKEEKVVEARGDIADCGIRRGEAESAREDEGV